MAGLRKKKTVLNRTPTYLIFLLVKFFLIKLGSFPGILIKGLGTRFQGLVSQTAKTLFLLISNIYRLIPTSYRLVPKKRGRKVSPIKYYFRKIPKNARLPLAIVLVFLIFTAYTFIAFQTAYQLPSPDRLTVSTRPLTTEFFDRNGRLLYRLYEGQNRTLVKINELPPYIAQATISIEDKNFYHHLGLDPVAIIRTFYNNITQKKLEGASTLTQQLIKNTILSPEKTYLRKAKEIVLAFWAERIYSKKQILQAYLNEAPYGGPLWGIEAASQTYFNKPSKKLDLAEAAFLAGLPASPTEYSPYGNNPGLGKIRQAEVLRRMREDGYISEKQEKLAYSENLDITPPTNQIKAPHFVMYIKDLLEQRYGSRVIAQGGLKIYTTLDLNLQNKVQNILSSEIDKDAYLNVKNGAAVVTDPKTGQILSMIGSRSYDYPGFGNYNAAIALRQPGSSIKPITYATAFAKGFSPGSSIDDSPITFKDVWGNSYTPVNYDSKFHGLVSLRTALGSSYNIPAVKVLQKVGLDNMIETARKLGITTFNDTSKYGLSLTLGAGDVRLVDMMSVYGTFSQMGVKRDLTGILRVIDSDGQELEEYEDTGKQVIKPETAYLVTDILSDNKARTPAFGPNSALQIPGYSVAVKTGTTDNKRDNWTFGYTSDYVVGVWVGNNDNSKMDPKLTSGITGAAPIWNKIIHTLVDGHIPVDFARPTGIVDTVVDGRKDIADSEFIPKQAQMRNNYNFFQSTFSAITSIKKEVNN